MLPKINKYLFKSIYWLTALFSFLFFIMVCLNVFTRYVLKTPILVSIELSRIFFVWSCFFAAGITLYKQGHIAISFITDLIPSRGRRMIGFITEALTVVFFTGIHAWSVEVVVKIWKSEFPVLGISQSWLYVPLALISFVMLLFSIERMFNVLKTTHTQI
ncbi:MAG: TRAP transporter small permease [Cyclobacteriaceae bacterium]|nr:TRAP transporter small permease [Cyclobacteriaceae bacterium]